MDTNTASGKFVTTILTAVAEFEREFIGSRARDGQIRAGNGEEYRKATETADRLSAREDP